MLLSNDIQWNIFVDMLKRWKYVNNSMMRNHEFAMSFQKHWTLAWKSFHAKGKKLFWKSVYSVGLNVTEASQNNI